MGCNPCWQKFRAAFLAAVLSAAPAYGQAIPRQFVDLTYDVDAAIQACPDVSEFRALVAQQLGYDPHRDGSPLGLRIHVESTKTGIEGAIKWRSHAEKELGERRVAARNENCREMVATVAFVAAVQIQLMAAEHVAEPASQSDDNAEPIAHGLPANPPPEDDRRVATVSTKPTMVAFEIRPSPVLEPNLWSAVVGLGPSVGFGLGPTPVLQGRLFADVQYRHATLEAGVEASLPSTTRQDYGGGFRHELIMGTLAACVGDLSISVCGLGKAGRIQVEGLGVDKPASPSGFIAQVGPRFGHTLSLANHLVLLSHIDALYLLAPLNVELNGMTVWRTPRLSAVMGFDLAIRFR